MQYFNVTGATHAEALKKLRAKYGNDAIIFAQKEIHASDNPESSLLDRILGKKYFLIEAAIKEKSSTKNIPMKNVDSLKNKNLDTLIQKANNIMVPKNNMTSESENFLNEIQKHLAKPIDTTIGKKDIPSKEKDLQSLKYDIDFIKENLGSLNYKKVPAPQDMSLIEMGKSDLAYLSSALLMQDFSQKWVLDFMQLLQSSLSPKDIKNEMKVRAHALELITSKIKRKSNFSKRYIALVGTTGVGKTTTIAKLAAKLKLEKNKSIALVTMDNYRIAATEQLKVYADILAVPFYSCKNKEQLKTIAMEEYADYILIDTAGVSHNNEDIMIRQKEALDILERDVEKHLVISATSKPSDAKNIIESFNRMNFDRIIISKIDETNTYGHLLELSEIWDKDFSFFSIGQNVPEDYMEVNPDYLAQKILKSPPSLL